MKKKPPVPRTANSKTATQGEDRPWHNGGDIEIALYARSLHKAAQNLISNLTLEPDIRTAWDACPAIPLYRQSVELHMKRLVGEGSNFLSSPTDPITLYKTHSLRWLAQIVCQIVKRVHWEEYFNCEGIGTLSDFSSVISDLEALDPVSIAVQSGSRTRDAWVPHQLTRPNIVRIAKQLDFLIAWLEVTADALAAEWDLRTAGSGDMGEVGWGPMKKGGSGPTTIQ